jgi:hypothetical protein
MSSLRAERCKVTLRRETRDRAGNPSDRLHSYLHESYTHCTIYNVNEFPRPSPTEFSASELST